MSEGNPIIISGLWIREGSYPGSLDVLVQVPCVDDRQRWRLCWSGPMPGAVGSVVLSPDQIRKCCLDPLTDGRKVLERITPEDTEAKP